MERPRSLKARSASRSRSGTQLPFGRGISLLTTAPSAEIISWISASSARQTRPPPPAKSVQSLGASVTTHSISIASRVGSKLGKYVRWTTATGSSRNTAAEAVVNPDGTATYSSATSYHNGCGGLSYKQR
ncbi:hypothetical protein CGRA01v4_07100 [Colletotrichum graminicola]|nr:hypothetical protein CGRA01v4_07100 [Colletotrichum graminicola]